MLRVIVVEDNHIDADAISSALKRAFDSLSIKLFPSMEDALPEICNEPHRFDLMITDYHLPDMSGVEAARVLRGRDIDLPIVILTGEGSESTAVEALRTGVNDYIPKDLMGDYLKILIVKIPEIISGYRARKEKASQQQEMARLADELASQNRELEAFAHTVAHDIKGPISNLLGYIEILLNSNHLTVDEEVDIIIRSMSRLGRKAVSIVDELLAFSQMKSQPIELHPFVMSEPLHNALFRLDDQIDQSRAEISVPDQWPTVVGYAPWVEEVWVNYIGNALKYGGDRPMIQLSHETIDQSTVRFSVIDYGPGIPEEFQETIFDPFVRLQSAKSSGKEGTGLGLSIVSRIVHRMGGDCGVESRVGRGTNFYFSLESVPDSMLTPQFA